MEIIETPNMNIKISKKTVKSLRKKLALVFNKFIRLRDKDKKCISCGVRKVQQAGHYWSTSQCPHPSMRFNEKNVNGQCTYCNSFLEGNRQGYREGLLKKYGKKVLEDLDIQRSFKKSQWGTFEYQSMIKAYKEASKQFS